MQTVTSKLLLTKNDNVKHISTIYLFLNWSLLLFIYDDYFFLFYYFLLLYF